MARAAEDEFTIVHDALMMTLSQASIGEFKHDIDISPENTPRVNEVLMGVQVLLEVIREKMDELEAAQSQLQAARDRSVNLLDEVLRKSLD